MNSAGGALALPKLNVVRPAVKDLLGQKIEEFRLKEEELRREEKRKELESRLFEIRQGVSMVFYSTYRTHFERPEYPLRDSVVYKMHFELFSDKELLIIAEFIFSRADKDQLRLLSDFKLLYSEKEVFEREMLEIIKNLYRSTHNWIQDNDRLTGFSFKLLEEIAKNHGDPSIRESFKERIGEFRKIEFNEMTLPGLRKKIKKYINDIWRHQTGTRLEFMRELSDDELLEYVKTIIDGGCKKTSWREFLLKKAQTVVENNIFNLGLLIENLDKIREHFPDEADFNRELFKALRGPDEADFCSKFLKAFRGEGA